MELTGNVTNAMGSAVGVLEMLIINAINVKSSTLFSKIFANSQFQLR